MGEGKGIMKRWFTITMANGDKHTFDSDIFNIDVTSESVYVTSLENEKAFIGYFPHVVSIEFRKNGG